MKHKKHTWHYSPRRTIYWCSRCPKAVSKTLAGLSGAVILPSVLDEIVNRPIKLGDPPDDRTHNN